MRSMAARRALSESARNLAFARDPNQADVLAVLKNLEVIVGEMTGKECQFVAIFKDEEAQQQPLAGQFNLFELLEPDQ